jgi:hypothetical protein
MKRARLVGLLVGTLVAAPAIFAAMLSAGGGHGDYFWAGVLFPIPLFLLTFGFESSAVVYLFVQFTAYGFIWGSFWPHKKKARAAVWLSALHGVPMLVFLGLRFTDHL